MSKNNWIPYAWVFGLIGLVSLMHYSTALHIHQLHDIYRRLYYIPIVLAAFAGGWRGGLIISALVCIVYAPHAFGSFWTDPASHTEKVLEMIPTWESAKRKVEELSKK